ncbi:DDE transposase [Capsulimonas corticalis]|uniref:DDE transposase n=1 Tax=Capsulimonas corticalis TaxID=2219043 RepID=A0A402D1H6_9BACT|nr:IS5 family transposase [Capsulimonas corticalis]BDI31596.1 DDE transposase [Capsulimonas corticalis]
MAKELVSDELWELVAPLIPAPKPKKISGRPRVADRKALTGILFILRTGIPWEYLPQEMGCGSGMTCWRRLRDWNEAGVWQRLHLLMLDKLGIADQINWERASIDASLVPAKHGGSKTGKNPTDRGKPGSKRHLVVDQSGHILVAELTAANVNETTLLPEQVDAIPAIRSPRGRWGRRRRRSTKLHADKGYASKNNRRQLRKRGITPRIARPGVESSQKLGRHRWVVERAFALVNQFRRLRVRDERQGKLYQAFLLIAATWINARALNLIT